MIKVTFLEDEPIILAALAVKISQASFEEGDIQTLYEQCRANKEESVKLVNRVLKSEHRIFGDFTSTAIALEGLSRLAAIYLWRNVNTLNLIFGAGIEASFRVIRPNKHNEVVADFGRMVFETYSQFLEAGMPEQDARYVLSEGTITRMVFSALPRYYLKLAQCLKQAPLSELREIGTALENYVKEKSGFEMTEEKIYSEWPFWGASQALQGTSLDYHGGKIHSISLNMETEGSLAMYAQLVRQRQFLCEIEPLETIARKATFVIPPTFTPAIIESYQSIAKIAHQRQMAMIKAGDPNFAYFLLLGQSAQAIIYGKGAGVMETAKTRSEGVAQWEIRNIVGIPLARRLAKHEELEKEIGPRCWREKKCIEPKMFKDKKAKCPAFAKAGGCWSGNLEELLETLREPYKVFKL